MVADYFVQMRLYEKYKPLDIRFVHADEMLKLMSVLTGDKRYEIGLRTGKKVHSMCEAMELAEKTGYDRGVNVGYDRGVIKILTQLGYSIETMMKELNLKEEEIREIQNSIEIHQQ